MGRGKVQMKGHSGRFAIYNLCTRKQYFTCGSTNQYEKMFQLVEEGIHLEIIARIIWVCSNDRYSYKDIYKDCYETLMVEE